MKPLCLGVIVGNRGFFPDHLADTGRKTMLKVLAGQGIKVVALDEVDTTFGSIESLADTHKCVDLFKKHRDEIDGVLVTLPNFGDERAVSNALRWAALDVPILVHAFADDPSKMTITDRRDAFCGKMSLCNNLTQYSIRYTLTSLHTVDPESEDFQADLRMFSAVCRIVRGLRNARIGMLGARPAAFNTVRFSEKLFEQSGISIETLDLSEVLRRAAKMKQNNPILKAKLEEISAYIPTKGVPSEALTRMAKLGAVIDQWISDQELNATAVQCWTAMEEIYGIVPCALMSMMSNKLLPSACETDIPGVVGMLALTLASNQPSAIVDWNNNMGKDPDKAMLFHCSNLPKDLFVPPESEDAPKMDYQAIISGSVGKDNAYGTVVGRLRSQWVTFCRVSTDDAKGQIRAYVGHGIVQNEVVNTFGGYGVIRIPHLQQLLAFICENGFEHHVAITPGYVVDAIQKAFSNYLGWDVHRHPPFPPYPPY